MNLKYLILLAIPLAACGGNEADKAANNPVQTPIAAKTVTVSSEMRPMERGAKLYKRCKACHTLDNGGKHKVGPNLWAVYGQKAGAKEGFAYSKAMASSDVIWNEATMDGYITKPSEFMKGNRMSFVGIKKQEDRDALQIYLKAQTSP